MERGFIVQDYFRLRDYFNRANKLSNQKTELRFEIEAVGLAEFRLYAIAVGVNELHRIAVAERTTARIWERTGHTTFKSLEEFCAEILNRNERGDDEFVPFRLSDLVKDDLCKGLEKRLKALLLNKNYEP